VSTPSDASGHSRLFDSFAYHHAVFLKLLRQYGVQKRVATRVQRQHKHREHFGLFQRDEVKATNSCQRYECYGGPAQQIGEHEQRHTFSDPRIVGIPGLGASDGAIHFQVTSHEYEKCHAIYKHQKYYVHQTPCASGSLEWQARGILAVVRNAEQWQRGHPTGENPTTKHYVRRVFK